MGNRNTGLCTSSPLLEMAPLGIKTKKGKNAKGQIGELKLEVDADFRKQF